jgi:hypothetical protein
MIVLEDGTVLANIVEIEPGCYEKDDRLVPCERCDFGDVSDGVCNCCGALPGGGPWFDYGDDTELLFDAEQCPYLSRESALSLFDFEVELLRRRFAA